MTRSIVVISLLAIIIVSSVIYFYANKNDIEVKYKSGAVEISSDGEIPFIHDPLSGRSISPSFMLTVRLSLRLSLELSNSGYYTDFEQRINGGKNLKRVIFQGKRDLVGIIEEKSGAMLAVYELRKSTTSRYTEASVWLFPNIGPLNELLEIEDRQAFIFREVQ